MIACSKVGGLAESSQGIWNGWSESEVLPETNHTTSPVAAKSRSRALYRTEGVTTALDSTATAICSFATKRPRTGRRSP